RKIADMDTGRPVRDPNDDWYHAVDGQGFFLVPLPRSAWRSPYLPGALPRPYTRRALLLSRIVPAVIRGLPVRFTVHPRTGLAGSALRTDERRVGTGCSEPRRWGCVLSAETKTKPNKQ
ncbi:hypothetical protein, partial [Methylobacterium radiotolerans]|uniref:hypothetical protein n=1 Tax=Methylobacterium radiotolerans TaxID=31998 RepID=UPI001AECDE19